MTTIVPPGGGIADQLPICGEVRFVGQDPLSFCLWDVSNDFMQHAQQCVRPAPISSAECTLSDYNEQLQSIRIDGQLRTLAPALRPATMPTLKRCVRRSHDNSFKSATASVPTHKTQCMMLRVVQNDGQVRHYLAAARDTELSSVGSAVLEAAKPCLALRERVLTQLWRTRKHKKKLFILAGVAAEDSDAMRHLARGWGASDTVSTTPEGRHLVLIASASVGHVGEFSVLGDRSVVLTTEISSKQKFTLVVPLALPSRAEPLREKVPAAFVEARMLAATTGDQYVPVTSSTHREHLSHGTMPLTSSTLGSWLADKLPTGLRASEHVIVLGFGAMHAETAEATHDGMRIVLRRAKTPHCCAQKLDARFVDPRARVTASLLTLNRTPARMFVEPLDVLRSMHFSAFALLGAAGTKRPSVVEDSDMTAIQDVYASLSIR